MTTKIFYNSAYTGAGQSFDTTRKSGWIAKSLAAKPVRGVEIVSPKPLTASDLAKVHSPKYVNAVQSGFPKQLAGSAGFGWDQGFWAGVCASNGGAVAAALTAYKHKHNAGSLSSGLHHASYERGMGFCAFNGLALAAHAVHNAGAQKVLIIDVDAHCGGGTFDLLKNCSWVDSLDISTSQLDTYIPDNVHWTMDIIRKAANYLNILEYRLQELDALGKEYDLVILNAGMDPYEDCMIGGMDGVDANMIEDREELIFSWAASRNTPVAFVLAGGYTGAKLSQEMLVDLHRMTIETAARY